MSLEFQLPLQFSDIVLISRRLHAKDKYQIDKITPAVFIVQIGLPLQMKDCFGKFCTTLDKLLPPKPDPHYNLRKQRHDWTLLEKKNRKSHLGSESLHSPNSLTVYMSNENVCVQSTSIGLPASVVCWNNWCIHSVITWNA